ncbi:MAG: hypothetical protein ACRDRS_16415 [Pseudonocardiaceae bacterium]
MLALFVKKFEEFWLLFTLADREFSHFRNPENSKNKRLSHEVLDEIAQLAEGLIEAGCG